MNAKPSTSRTQWVPGQGGAAQLTVARITRRLAPMAALLATLLLPLPAPAGETLYNGIVLPNLWPPKSDQLTREPMPAPCPEQRPDVVPIDIGRQLFVDDFLIETTTLHRFY
ncbi:MAG: hypothetical protein WCL11_24150, partial [Verrucomicrobiota bacterium]